MEIAIALIGMGLGVCCGLIAADMRQRLDAMVDIEKNSEEVRKLVAGLNETHNRLVLQIKTMGDRMGAIEFSLRSSSATTATRQVFK